jgi:tetratricopeptide (TPR) repeat protein
MNLDLSKLKKNYGTQESKKNAPDRNEENYNINRMMDYLTDSIQRSSVQTTPQTIQPPQGPSYTYNIANQAPEMPQQENQGEKAYKSGYSPKNYQEKMIEDPMVLDDLHRSQKLFYSKKYNAALNAVQRSLSRQETALGYALEGSIYFTLGDVDLAVSSWENALRLNPDMTEVKKVLFKYKR